MFQKTYLTETHLKGFDKYKYNCIDTSFFSNYVMHPAWNFMVKGFPTWLAPNLITFIGFILTISNFFLFAYYDYGFDAATKERNPIPSWVFLVSGINIFVAYNLDGMDGKQARRTSSSTPLGELFDHGLDSYSSVFIALYLFSLFGRHDLPPMRMQAMTICVYLNFYLTHFEKYNTGVMFLPWGYDFLMWGLAGLLVACVFFGPGIWTTPVFGYTPTVILEVLLYSSSVFTSWPVIAFNIYKSYRDRTGKLRSFNEAVRPLYPLFALFIISTAWAIWSMNGILQKDPRMFFIMTGTIFSNISCRLIVAQMSDTRAEAWNFQLTLLGFAAAVFIFPYNALNIPTPKETLEIGVLYTLAIVVTVLQVHYGICVVLEMCNHLKIKCFKILQPEDAICV